MITAPTPARPQSRRPTPKSSPFDRPADLVLWALRLIDGGDYRCTETGGWGWRATCPVCRYPGLPLTIREPYLGGPVTLRCRHNCREAHIVTALGQALPAPEDDA